MGMWSPTAAPFMIFTPHHQVVDTAEEAAALAVKEGCDLNCGQVYPALLKAVEQGLIDESTVNKGLRRLLEARFRLGMFDPPERVPYAQIPYDIVNNPRHQALALQMAQESIVLLKNEGGLLPLSKDLSSIAVIGPNADDLQVLLGNYHGTAVTAVSPLNGICQKVRPETKVYYSPGCDIAEGIPTLSVVPSACLRPLNGDAGQHGMTAVYYDNAKFKGDPVRVQINSLVDFAWKGVSPLSGGWGDPFSVRWEGYLVPPMSGTYTLGTNCYNQVDVYLDEEHLIDIWHEHHPRITARQVELEAGRLYQLRLDYASSHLDPQMQLLWTLPDMDYEADAIAAAEKADVVVMVMGLTANLEGEEMPVQVVGFDRGDRTDINLPPVQEKLLKRIHGLGKPIVLVLLNGSALAVNWADENIPTIIEAWYPGEAGGTAVADVLFGDYNPGGRLPVTFYKTVDDLPPFENYDMDGRTYRYFEGEPLYAFGHGLSYTDFDYNDLKITPSQAGADDTVTVSFEVTNIGKRHGG